MKAIEHVSIVGMGALGMLFGNIIAKHIGSEQVSYIMDNERYERHKDERYLINGEQVDFSKVRADAAQPCDLLIVAVKYTDLSAALDTMKTSIGKDTIIISVMNGISSEEIIGARYGIERVIHTVAQGMDAMHFGTALTYTKSGELCIGVDDPTKEKTLKRLIEFFDRSGVAYSVEKDIKYRMWGKFMINVGANQTCMVYGTNYAGVLAPESEEYMTLIGAMREVILLANAENVHLTEADLKYYLALIKTFSPDGTPSMGQDRINKRRSEVELFAGTVIRLARQHDIPVPVNEFLYRRVYEIEKTY